MRCDAYFFNEDSAGLPSNFESKAEVIITSLPEIYENLYHFSKGILGLTYWGVGTFKNG